MPSKKKLNALTDRIHELEAANSSLKAQLAASANHKEIDNADLGALKASSSSIEEELKSLRTQIDKIRLGPEKERLSLTEKIAGVIDGTEQIVFRLFLAASTVIGAANLLTHEVTALRNAITPTEEQTPNEQKEGFDAPGRRALENRGGAEPIPERIRIIKEQLLSGKIEFRADANGNIQPLYAASYRVSGIKISGWKPLSPTVAPWLNLDKIGEPNSVHNFLADWRTSVESKTASGQGSQPDSLEKKDDTA
ncbi:MAG: hypothetical protein ACLPY1_03010 [Terracidiphilus sp.]